MDKNVAKKMILENLQMVKELSFIRRDVKCFACKDLFIITMDSEDEISIEDNVIHVLPLWKMLLKGI